MNNDFRQLLHLNNSVSKIVVAIVLLSVAAIVALRLDSCTRIQPGRSQSLGSGPAARKVALRACKASILQNFSILKASPSHRLLE